VHSRQPAPARKPGVVSQPVEAYERTTVTTPATHGWTWIMDIYSGNQTKHVKTLCGQKAELVHVKVGATYKTTRSFKYSSCAMAGNAR
jgi:hypothetical protein